jgi:hypothetical protein
VVATSISKPPHPPSNPRPPNALQKARELEASTAHLQVPPQPSKRKASEKSNDEERPKNSPEEGDGEGEALIEVGERYSAIIIRREVLTRRVAVAGGWPNHQRVDGEDIVIEM